MFEKPPYPTLKFMKDGKILFDNQQIPGNVDMTTFLTAVLDQAVELEEGITIGEIIHSLYGLRKFIESYCSEEYETTRAFMAISKFNGLFKELKIYKKFVTEDGYFNTIVMAELVPTDDLKEVVEKISEIPVVFNEATILEHNDIEYKTKSRIKFSEFIKAVFSEFSHKLKTDSIIAV